MSQNKTHDDKFERLRQLAEEMISRLPIADRPEPAEMPDLISDLRVYEAELEIQNEDLKRAQEEISILQKEYEDLYEFAPCGYVALNPKGIITRINLAATTLLGQARDFYKHAGFSQFLIQGMADTYHAARKKAGETGEKQSVELLLKREERFPVWVHGEIVADRDENNTVTQWRMVLSDISEKKAAEALLMEREERFRELFEHAPVAYQSLDARGNLIAVNETWLSTLGYHETEVIGTNFSEFLHSEWRETFKKDFPRFKRVGEVIDNEFLMVQKDGTEILVSFNGKIATDYKGKFKQTHCVFYDITAQREAEEEKARLEEELRQAAKMDALGTLAGGIAHEFNNVLGIIIGNTELAYDDVPEWNPARSCLEEIKAASLRAKDVVRQILSFTRKITAERKPIQVSTILKEVMKLIRATIPASIQITQSISCDREMILGNPTEINQILLNLCTNASQAIPEERGLLHVTLEPVALDEKSVGADDGIIPGDYVKLTVRDDGTGVDPNIQDKIFDPYFTTKDIGEGVGMGLAIVYGLVKKHDGTIRLISEMGKGTTVEVLLPIVEGEVEEPPDESEIMPTGNERVLFVDDEPSLADMASQMLNRLGYDVKAETSSQEALELFKTEPNRFDLVITDMAMPEMAGDQLAQELLKIQPDIPIILCTGHSARIDEQRAKEFGFKAYVMKPLVMRVIAQKIREVLDKKH